MQLVRDHDLAYRQRGKTSDVGGWRGRGTSALFLTNRELSELAAVHLFKVRPLRRSGRLELTSWTTGSPLFSHSSTNLHVLRAAAARPSLHPRHTRTRRSQSQARRQLHSFPYRQLRRRLPFPTQAGDPLLGVDRRAAPRTKVQRSAKRKRGVHPRRFRDRSEACSSPHLLRHFYPKSVRIRDRNLRPSTLHQPSGPLPPDLLTYLP